MTFPAHPYSRAAEILENEQIKANELIHQYEHPGLGQIRQPRPGAKFSRSEIRQQPIAPRLGEHSREILTEHGFSDDDIKALIDSRVVLPSDD